MRFLSLGKLAQSQAKIGLTILTSAMILVCFGCASQKAPISYESLCELSPEQIARMDEEKVRQWIEDKHEAYHTINLDQSLQEEDKGRVFAFTWGNTPGYTGTAYLRDGHLFRISLDIISYKVTFGEVVDHFGTPEWVFKYATIRETVLYYLQLDYPSKGISFSTTSEEVAQKLEHNGKLAITLQEKARVTRIDCYTPSTMEEVLREDYFLSAENVEANMNARKSWPGFGASLPLTK